MTVPPSIAARYERQTALPCAVVPSAPYHFDLEPSPVGERISLGTLDESTVRGGWTRCST